MADHRAARSSSTTWWSAAAQGVRLRILFLPVLIVCALAAPAALVILGPSSSSQDRATAMAAEPLDTDADPSLTTTTSEVAPTTPPPPPPTTAPPPTPLRVALVGDSLLAMARPQVDAALTEHEVIALDGRPGHLIGQQFDTAVAMAAQDPDVLVVILGANDAGPDFTREAMEHDVTMFLDAVAAVRCIKWVTVQEDFYLPGTSAGSHGTLTLNVTLFREAAQRPNLEVIDFAPTINDQPEWHAMDILHLDGRGSQALADSIGQSIECANQPEDTP